MTTPPRRVPSPDIVLRSLGLLLLASTIAAQDVYVPPVPIGIARDGKVRKVQSPIAFPNPARNWVRVRTPRFDVISSASDQQTRRIVSNLETMAAVLTRFSPRFGKGHVPTTVLIFADRKESLPYFELLLGRTSPEAT